MLSLVCFNACDIATIPAVDPALAPAFNGQIETSQEVDMGVSVKWAGYNLGAQTPAGVGTYVAWNETAEKPSYLRENYAFYKEGAFTLEAGSALTADVVTKEWGGDWRTPTPAQFKELLDTCSVVRASYNGVNGWVLVSKVKGFEGKSIFFPAAGYKGGSNLHYFGEQGSYWLNVLVAGKNDFAQNVFFKGNTATVNDGTKGIGSSVWCGLPVRPVKYRN